jgi:HTH-type transcriptional regulator/antitoxin HigA
MKAKVIKTESKYASACERLSNLMHLSEEPVAPGTPEGDELELLSLLVENYEREHYPILAPDPIEAIKFRMEQMNLKQKDIAILFGGKTRASEVLNKRRSLSKKMIILLNRYLGIPLESLVVGSESIKLKPSDRKELLNVPSINEFIKTHRDKKAFA